MFTVTVVVVIKGGMELGGGGFTNVRKTKKRATPAFLLELSPSSKLPGEPNIEPLPVLVLFRVDCVALFVA